MNGITLVTSVVPVLIALGAAYGAFRKAPSETKKINADASLVGAEASAIIIQNLTDEVHRLELKLEEEREFFQKEIASLRAENQRQARHLQRLETKLKEKLKA